MKITRLLSYAAIILILLGLACVEATAQTRGLFYLDQPLQFVDFNYQFQSATQSSTAGGSHTTTSNKLSPGYFFGVRYAILDPDVYTGFASIYLRYTQSFSDGSNGSGASNLALNYNFSGTFYARKPVSLSYSAITNQQWVQQDLAPGYDLTTRSYNLLASFKGRLLPTIVQYQRTDSSINSNIYRNQSVTNDLLTLQSSSTYRDISLTTLNLQYNRVNNSYGDNVTPAATYEEFTGTLSNSLNWSLGKNRQGSVSSSATYSDSLGNGRQQSLQIAESLNQSLGKALKTGATYSFTTFNDPQESGHDNTATLWLEHQLFQSLHSRIALFGDSRNFVDGKQEQLAAQASVSYTKILPRNSVFVLTVGDTYLWNSQNLTLSDRTKYDEQVAMDDRTSQEYRLANDNATAIISVKKLSDKSDVPLSYVELKSVGSWSYIVINPLSPIDHKETLIVSYSYKVDPSLTYAMNSVSLSGNLSFMGNLLRVYATYAVNQPHLISGSALYFESGNSTTLTAGIETNLERHSLGVQYFTLDNTKSSQYSLTPYWTYMTRYGVNSINLSVADTYTEESITNGLSPQKNSYYNVFHAWGRVSRPLPWNATVSLWSGYQNQRGYQQQSSYYLRLSYGLSLGKFMFMVNAQSSYTDQMISTRWQSLLNMNLRRSF